MPGQRGCWQWQGASAQPCAQNMLALPVLRRGQLLHIILCTSRRRANRAARCVPPPAQPRELLDIDQSTPKYTVSHRLRHLRHAHCRHHTPNSTFPPSPPSLPLLPLARTASLSPPKRDLRLPIDCSSSAILLVSSPSQYSMSVMVDGRVLCLNAGGVLGV